MSKKIKAQSEPWVHYTLNEEIANSVTHGIGTAFSIAGLTLLVTLAVQQHDPLKIASFAIYGMSLVILHLASTLYHALRTPWVKRLFRIFDHCSIYLLIAGTYTPFLLIGLHDSQGFLLLGVVWGLAALGIILQIALKGWFGKLSVLPYIGMGWLVVIDGRSSAIITLSGICSSLLEAHAISSPSCFTLSLRDDAGSTPR